MLISSSDPAMLEVQSNFIAAAAKAGVKHVVKLSGIMPELDSPFRFARMHGEIEQRLEASGMAFTHLRAGEFMPAYFRQVPLIVAKGALFLPMENARIASIDVGDIAEIAADVLTGAGHEGKIYPLTGPEALTMAEVAEKLSAATGKTIKYVNVAPEDAKKAQLAAGMPPYLADALAELFAERRKGKEANVSRVTETVFERRPTPFHEFAARNAAVFRGEQPAPKALTIKREKNMKHFLIKYRFKSGSKDEWHQEIARFIAALDNDPALKGKISYRCMKRRKAPITITGPRPPTMRLSRHFKRTQFSGRYHGKDEARWRRRSGGLPARDHRRDEIPRVTAGRLPGGRGGSMVAAATRENAMNEDVLNTSVRKFLKQVGVTSQREIEQAVRDAVQERQAQGQREAARPKWC